MPVNTAALKTFAPAMRRQLLEAVGRKLDLLLTSQTPDTLSTYAKQIAELREQEEENREQLMERVAYTWFNRLCALRYLDARGWHPFGCKVLMPAAEGETQPELLKLMRAGSLPTELKAHTNEARLHGLIDGQIPPAVAGADPQREVYRELVLASCRSYHQLLPELFEGLDAASELLLPDDLLSEGSIAGGFRIAISDQDCEDVEIIGWLYQFYISEKKDQVIGKVVKSEDIPAATQLFTPNWIVKYMVQNSLGAIWLATYPDSPLKDTMEFYIEPAEQPPEVQAQLAAITPESLDPEALTLIDPACGSGHILVEAYDLLKAIYLERGYLQREIPLLILEKNLFGLDIDERAAQLTSFALMMKSRGDDRRLFDRGIEINVMALVSSDGLDAERLANAISLADYGLKLTNLLELKQLFEHATTFGSLIQIPAGLAKILPALRRLSELKGQDMIVAEMLKCLEPLVRQAELLAARHDAVVANPPYMGIKGMNSLMKKFVQNHFPDSKSDLFACFIERGFEIANPTGYISMVTMESWMFLSSYEQFRKTLFQRHTIRNLAHFPYDGKKPTAMGINFGVTAFSAHNAHWDAHEGHFCCSRYFELNDDGVPLKFPTPNERLKTAVAEDFQKISGCPVAYWVNDAVIEVFSSFEPLCEILEPRQGLATADNDSFLRLWGEVSHGKVGFGISSHADAIASGKKWFPIDKGGEFRRWYGNQTHLVNWEHGGRQLKAFERSVIRNEANYFLDGVTWTAVSSSLLSVRRTGPGNIFSNAGMKVFAEHPKQLLLGNGFLNSTVCGFLVSCISQTLNFDQGVIARLPLNQNVSHLKDIGHLEALSMTDWDAYERSWNFQSLPLLSATVDPSPTLESSYTNWIVNNKQTIAEMKRLEEENNRLFIDAYGLQDELTPEVPIEQITLTVNPAYRYGGNLSEDELWIRFRQDTIRELLSYATGCMMGRYSIDHPGLILADSCESQAAQLAAYEEKVGKPLSEVQFKPDPDGIIPVLDGEWFEDDIVARTREFLGVTFPESTVTENLRFIEDSLGKDIRKYFCSEFYKDHLQTYKKRPIYWMVQSPKKGFACLIYLHRYTKDSLNQVLNNYFRPYLQKLEARLAQLGLDQLNDDLPARERTAARKEAEKITKVLKECQAWEQDALLPLAQQRIELDLDDGVKVNYLKLQDVLAPIPGLAAKED